MNNMKKLASLLLALVMLLAVAAPAMALEGSTGYTITINGAFEGHTYAAYQIFAGELHEGTLSNITWGVGVNTAAEGFVYAGMTAVEVAETVTSKEQAAAFADAIGQYLTTSSAEATVAANANSCELTGLEAGYYLVKNTSVPAQNGAYTAYILKVVKDVEASPKTDVPEVVKKVKDTNDTAGVTTDWQDSADHDINDKVSFLLKATLANNVDAYDTYKIIFHDTLSAGLTYNGDAVVKFGENVVTDKFTITHENGKLTISCNDVKAFGAGNGAVITVEYTATLNSNAVIGSTGNPNEVYLEYSNNPNAGGEGSTGKTPEDKVIVFTYKTIANKVDEAGEALVGAGFTLYKKNADTDEYEIVGEELVGGTMTEFEWKGLDDGDYMIEETTTPAGYNTIDPIYFTITAEHDTNSADPKLTSLTVTSSADVYEEDGITVKDYAFNADKTAGTATTTVVNEKGVNLPSTGGMGTTLFYLMGAVLLAGAAVVVVSKKRAIEK